MLDNFSSPKHPTVREWAADNDVELVFLPTYGSWLNWIEFEFAALRYFALSGTAGRRAGLAHLCLYARRPPAVNADGLLEAGLS